MGKWVKCQFNKEIYAKSTDCIAMDCALRDYMNVAMRQVNCEWVSDEKGGVPGHLSKNIEVEITIKIREI